MHPTAPFPLPPPPRHVRHPSLAARPPQTGHYARNPLREPDPSEMRLPPSPDAGRPTGVGVVTFNRLPVLAECVRRVREFTASPYELVVADDGSTDGTADWCRENGVACVTGPNGGAGVNKARALLALMARTDCDPLILLEEECQPDEAGWEARWRAAALRWHHVNFFRPAWHWVSPLAGEGTPMRPLWSEWITGQCTATSRAAMRLVGYPDPRLRGFGEEHVEWTYRFARALGWPPFLGHDASAAPYRRYVGPVLGGGLRDTDAGTYTNRAEIERNIRIHEAIQHDPVYRDPWIDDAERRQMMDAVGRAAL